MLRTEGIVDRSRDLTSMFDESLDMDSRHSALSSSDFSDREHGSHRSDNFNGFDQGNVVLADIFDHDELSSTQNRLDTFKLWPVGSPILPIDLATAGFYYLGADDQVKCYKCDLVLRQWRTGEDPWVEHKQFRPSCPFIREVESGSRFEVTCEPVEASVNDEGQLPFAQRFPRYGDQRFPSAMPVEPRSIEAEPSSFDPPFSMYPERFQERAVQEERSSGYRDPMDAQAGYRSQQPGYQGRLPEYQDRDIQTTAYQRPEAGKRNQYVVVGQGPDRVHVQGAAVYQLQPEDKVCVRVERQGLPRHVTSVRDLKPVHPERHEVSQHSTASESTSKAFQPPSMELNQESSGSRLPFTTMASSPYYPAQPSKAGLYEQSGGKNFAEETGRQYRHESTAFQAGIVAPMYTTQQSQGRPMQSLTKSGKPSDKSFSQETGAFKAGYDKPRPVSVAQMQPGRENKMYPSQPGPGYYDPYATQKSGANEESLAHETGNRTSHYPENMKRLQTGGEEENYPPQPSRETGRPQNPPGPNARGTRTPFPGNVALPVQDPSLGTVQRPLFRQEEARHVASPSELSSEHHRLTTFVDWPPDCPIREWELSVAGFYYLGSSDSVKCYKCGIALRNWDPTDTPWGEHKKWSPDCPLVIEHFSGRARAPEENLQRQRTSSRERFTFSPEEHPSQRPEQPQAPNDWQVPVRRSGSPPNDPRERSEQTPAHVVSSPSIRQGPVSGQQCGAFYPQGTNASTSEEGHMVSGVQTLSSGVMEGRSESQRSPNRPSLSSPASFPRGVTSLDFDMERLAEMGFTQREVDEAVSKRIEDAGDTFNNFGELVFALVERQERPAGRVLLPRSPMQTNQNAPLPTVTIPTITTSSLPRANTNNRAGNSTSAVTSPTTPAPWRESLRRTFSAPVASLTESEESLEQKLERMQEERTCKICMDDEVGVVFQPCGHLSCCPECATGMDLCPMCRAPIQEKIRTYLS